MVNSTRSVDVSLNSAAPRAHSNLVISEAPDPVPTQQNQLIPVRPSIMHFGNPRVENSNLNQRMFGCENYGGNHNSYVCQEKDPWEYVAPFLGSTYFGQGFFSILVPDVDMQPMEQLNYAHISIE
jgi:hypothetical protein